tara:strand:+ start:355 stop:561 length:207 start_codon:yes stop_codon:yes gene_type:complete
MVNGRCIYESNCFAVGINDCNDYREGGKTSECDHYNSEANVKGHILDKGMGIFSDLLEEKVKRLPRVQ